MKFTVVENPSVTRHPVIKVNGKSGKLMMKWDRPTADEAADLLDEVTELGYGYVDIDTGELLSVVADDQLENVERRTMKDVLVAQREFMRRMIVGFGDSEGDEAETDDGTEINGLLLKWGLLDDEDEPLDFKDDDVFDMVFAESDYLFPVIKDFVEMLTGVAVGSDRVKNSKTSGRSGRSRKGRFKA